MGQGSGTAEKNSKKPARLVQSPLLLFIPLHVSTLLLPNPAADNSYGTVTTLAMFINCIVGTGCFNLPHAFISGGWLLTSVLLCIGGILGSITCQVMRSIPLSRASHIPNAFPPTTQYTLELMARAGGLRKAQEEKVAANKLQNEKVGCAARACVCVRARARVSICVTLTCATSRTSPSIPVVKCPPPRSFQSSSPKPAAMAVRLARANGAALRTNQCVLSIKYP